MAKLGFWVILIGFGVLLVALPGLAAAFTGFTGGTLIPPGDGSFRTCPAPPVVNPAEGYYFSGTADDPLAVFSRRPLDHFIIPQGGLFMDPSRDEPHHGIDYTYPTDYLEGKPLWVHPIAPGYVTARSTCEQCFIDGGKTGQLYSQLPLYNFGYGALLVIETPYNSRVSIYAMYAHLGSEYVCPGDAVTPSRIVGTAGITGNALEIHVHLETRYGPPGAFWNADFSQQDTMDRWLTTPLINPAALIFPESHASLAATLDDWVGPQLQSPNMP
jgi:murein DD-endopeptidase MepM/ murein hydrolase activator NlpD